jgi:hypothetical protein
VRYLGFLDNIRGWWDKLRGKTVIEPAGAPGSIVPVGAPGDVKNWEELIRKWEVDAAAIQRAKIKQAEMEEKVRQEERMKILAEMERKKKTEEETKKETEELAKLLEYGKTFGEQNIGEQKEREDERRAEIDAEERKRAERMKGARAHEAFVAEWSEESKEKLKRMKEIVGMWSKPIPGLEKEISEVEKLAKLQRELLEKKLKEEEESKKRVVTSTTESVTQPTGPLDKVKNLIGTGGMCEWKGCTNKGTRSVLGHKLCETHENYALEFKKRGQSFEPFLKSSLMKFILPGIPRMELENLTLFFINAIIFGLYLWFGPYNSLIRGFITLLIGMAGSSPALYAITEYLIWATILIASLLVGQKLSEHGVGGLVYLTLIIGISWALFSAFAPIFEAGGPLGNEMKFFTCLLESRFDYMQCTAVTGQVKIPEAKKVGVRKILDIRFGREGIPFPLVRYDEVYEFPVTITNPTEYDMEGIVAGGGLMTNETKGVSLIDSCLTPMGCNVSDNCKLTKNSMPLVVNYRTTSNDDCSTPKNVTTEEGKYVYLQVAVTHPFNTSGWNDFILANNERFVPRFLEDCENTNLRRSTGTPCAGAGPLDVVLYFDPPFYVNGTGKPNDKDREICGGEQISMILYIDILNKGSGNATLEKFRLSKFAPEDRIKLPKEGQPTNSKNCYIRGLRDTSSIRFAEDEWVENVNKKIMSNGVYSFVCEYCMPIALNMEEPYKDVKYQLQLNYKYTEKASSDRLRVNPPITREV